MTDAHCHVTGGDPSVREFLIGRDFIGVHPWDAGNCSDCSIVRLRERLVADPRLGVGEIGLDRLRTREISPGMREVFEAQLKLALEFHRPVVLHGAKCWGQVVETVRKATAQGEGERGNVEDPAVGLGSSNFAFLFHGFSRSDGLIPDIVALNGYISVGPAVLNGHAVNYRELVRRIPPDRLLVETDRTVENAADCPSVRDVAAAVAELRGLSLSELEILTDRNAARFFPDPCSLFPLICYNTPK